MKSTLAAVRQLQAAEAQAQLAAENNRLLLLICERLEINPDWEHVPHYASPELPSESSEAAADMPVDAPGPDAKKSKK